MTMTRLPLLAATLLTCTLTFAAPTSGDWLNVREHGVSGSDFATTAATTAGSKQITVTEVGDFQVGQAVMISKANVRYTPTFLWGTGERYKNMKPLNGSVEVRGYDGTAGSWVTYLLDIKPSAQPSFRWSDDLGRTWQPEQRITHDWQKLNGGLEVKLNERDWQAGYVIAFGGRDQLISRITKIEGNVLTLDDAANRTITDGKVRHNDTRALQAAINKAQKEKLKVYIPSGHYRLSAGLEIRNPGSVTIEGANPIDTIIDISEGEGACFMTSGGTEFNLRNLSMVGFMGFDERDKAGELRTFGSTAVWGFFLKPCNALEIRNTRRVFVENCHGSKMSRECFVATSRSRTGQKAGPEAGFSNQGVKAESEGDAPDTGNCEQVTYLRCSVTNSARNAFNDVMCGSENTSVLQCRIVDVGGCTWEGASRYVKFIGNYVRNAGVVGMGNLGPANRDSSFPTLGSGQHIIADNVFEDIACYGAAAIRTSRGATQVIIRNNLFINFRSPAIDTGGGFVPNEYQSANTLITGNIIDLTSPDGTAKARTAITVDGDDTTVTDNQIYVRGKTDPLVTAIHVREPSRHVLIHGNLIRDCGTGLQVSSGFAPVNVVLNPTSFTPRYGRVPMGGWQLRDKQYHGWQLNWLKAGKPVGSATIENYDFTTLTFTLTAPADFKPGDLFEIHPPQLNWNIRANTLSGCLNPIVIDAIGSETSLIHDNLISRGDAPPSTTAIRLTRGQFELTGNRLSGFAPAPAR